MDVDTLVFIRVNERWVPAQIMGKRGKKYLVETYRDHGNASANPKYQYWRHEKYIKIFTYESWTEHGDYGVMRMRHAFNAYKSAGGYVPALRMRPTTSIHRT